jgi:peroxiredoxin
LGIIEVGRPLPAIRLKDQDRTEVDLGALQGTKLLLSFHPLAWTGVCQRQMEGLEAKVDALAELNARAFGISVDAVPAKRAWADAIGIDKTRLLSDFWPHGAAAASLGLFREAEGFSERAVVITDGEGIVRFVKVYPMSEVPDMNEQLDALRSL